jgi:hypothetical protein
MLLNLVTKLEFLQKAYETRMREGCELYLEKIHPDLE